MGKRSAKMKSLTSKLISGLIGMVACFLFVVAMRFFREGLYTLELFVSYVMGRHEEVGSLIVNHWEIPFFEWQADQLILYVYLVGVVFLFATKLWLKRFVKHPLDSDGQESLIVSLFGYTLVWFVLVSLCGLGSLVTHFLFS